MLNKLKWKFTRFMYGRYGVDQLYKASVLLYCITSASSFCSKFLLSVLIFALIFWTFTEYFLKTSMLGKKKIKYF